jgi:hypothetical protein
LHTGSALTLVVPPGIADFFKVRARSQPHHLALYIKGFNPELGKMILDINFPGRAGSGGDAQGFAGRL